MKMWRLILPLLISIAISYSSYWITSLYETAANGYFHSLGQLKEYDRPCAEFSTVNNRCEKLYHIPVSKGFVPKISDSLLSLGAGVLSGGSEWYCEAGSKFVKFHQTGTVELESTFRDGINLYQFSNIPANCGGDVWIVMKRDLKSTTTQVGWKSGSLVVGAAAVVTSYKSLYDFCASYIRALLGIVALAFALALFNQSSKANFGLSSFRVGAVLFSIHFATSSSLFDFLFPNRFNLSFPLLMASGTTGALFILVSMFENLKKRQTFKSQPAIGAIAFSLMFIFYATIGGSPYVYIQLVVALLIVAASLASGAPAMLVFSCLMTMDVLSLQGVLPGFPRNASSHFLIINFICDGLEWVYLNSQMLVQLADDSSIGGVKKQVGEFAGRFGIKRLSISMFTPDHLFRTYQLKSGLDILQNESEKITRISANVMTARIPLYRIRVTSAAAVKLKGDSQALDKKRGKEFSVFPLIHAERVFGTLNITNYNATVIGDLLQSELFISLIDKLLPKLAEAYYKRDLSPNIDEQKKILEVETIFTSSREKDLRSFCLNIDRLAKTLDCKVIISRKVPNENRMLTFSNHNYSSDDAAFLDTHSPKLSDTIVASPANVAFRLGEMVYVNNIQRMFAVYPDFLVKLLKQNETESLIVLPVSYTTAPNSPWGVVWIELRNKYSRPEADLKDLAIFIAHSIERQLLSHLAFVDRSRVTTELEQLLPARIVAKLKSGDDVREQDIGFLLNIDLCGSTALAKKIGDKEYSAFVSRLGDQFDGAMHEFGFELQMINWDAFIFTRSENGTKIDERVLQKILVLVDQVLQSDAVSFRAVLHYGDITRDLINTGTKFWTITGAALAESCKLEAKIKGSEKLLFISEACKDALEAELSRKLTADGYLVYLSDDNSKMSA